MNTQANGDKLTKRRSLWIVLLCLALALVPPAVHWVTMSGIWHRTAATAVFSYDPIYQVNAAQNLRAAKALFQGESRLSFTQSAGDPTLFSVQAHFWNTRDAADYVAYTVKAIGNRIRANNSRRTYQAKEDAMIAESTSASDSPAASGEIRPSYMGRFRVISAPVPLDFVQIDYQPIVSTAMLSGIVSLLVGSLLWQLLPRAPASVALAYPQIPRTPFFLP